MCGAAAESAILAGAIAKTRDERKVLSKYAAPKGRAFIAETVFGRKPTKQEERFISSAFYLLAYWRDEAAHGQASAISELDAYHALSTLLRLAQFLCAEWEALTDSK